ncbi:unnamed protein product [Echinostoma caproni]|uniref:Glutamine-dependent NAD(+) synthetase n=1 Tax=Echinostoma caproni TaxID=27848 RepID=A0A183AU45_9TREM|nr:unnamed protein product [Echinostoma caproni]
MCLSMIGQIFCQGIGSRGQLGLGDLEDRTQFTFLEALGPVTVIRISAGKWHAACVTDTGDLYTWGWNEYGQLGHLSLKLHKKHDMDLTDCMSVVCVPKAVDLPHEEGVMENKMNSVLPLLNTGSKFTIGLCVLNQWALDFTGNTKRIIRSIEMAKRAGARYRLGPELELSGYGCADHFHELDTFDHSWQCLAKILKQTIFTEDMRDIVCDIGMPVLFSGVAYNCRVILLNGRILLIRPKLVLADGGLHRETRWFTAWPHQMRIVDYPLPAVVRHSSLNAAQASAPFGDALLYFTGDEALGDVTIGLETCEELWIGCPPHLQMYACGADVVLNASASHHELRKLSRRINLVEMASRSNGGGLYAYTNLRGCDAERVCYDGGAMAAVSGQLVFLGKQFGLEEVEVNVITTELDAIRSKRITNKSFGRAAAAATALRRSDGDNTAGYPIIRVEFSLCHKLEGFVPHVPSNAVAITSKPEEEIAQGPALWLWDILRRSKSAGFFLCLSGGLDSAAVACLVLSLCNQVYRAIQSSNSDVIQAVSQILDCPESAVRDLTPRTLCSLIFFTCYMPSENSSEETRSRAERLAKAIGSHHLMVRLFCSYICFVDNFSECSNRQKQLFTSFLGYLN